MMSRKSAVAVDYAQVHDEYLEQQPDYKELAGLIGQELERKLAALGLEVHVLWREKTVLSFVKKALRKRYENPLEAIGDKAGVRVIVHYLDDVPLVEQVVGEICQTRSRDSKLDALDYDKLGYLGVHVEVQPKPELAKQSDNPRVGELWAELQIHTKAQSAWAVVSHDLLYKPPMELPPEIKRAVTRLVALVELFDDEVRRLRKAMKEHPDYRELMVIDELDDHIIRYTAQRPDRALSALSVPALVHLHNVDPERVVPDRVVPFLAQNRTKLDTIYQNYRDDSRANPLLFQPEALLLFERLSADPEAVRDAWPADKLPVELLEGLATIWGVDIGQGEPARTGRFGPFRPVPSLSSARASQLPTQAEACSERPSLVRLRVAIYTEALELAALNGLEREHGFTALAVSSARRLPSISVRDVLGLGGRRVFAGRESRNEKGPTQAHGNSGFLLDEASCFPGRTRTSAALGGRCHRRAVR
jgi:ppGpp synthetase/RelA/SpoT-type nucleotidyltranferase